MQRALKVARARSTVDCSCQALSARAFCGTSAGSAAKRLPWCRSRKRDRPLSIHARIPVALSASIQSHCHRPAGPFNRAQTTSCLSAILPATSPSLLTNIETLIRRNRSGPSVRPEKVWLPLSRGLPGTVLRTGSPATSSCAYTAHLFLTRARKSSSMSPPPMLGMGQPHSYRGCQERLLHLFLQLVAEFFKVLRINAPLQGCKGLLRLVELPSLEVELEHQE